MPNGDGTGPAWAGGNWRCRGRKGGFGPRCFAGRSMGNDEEREMLRSRLEMLKDQAEWINRRLAELGS
ncbi:MAG: DUF5320 domain-containing protein [Candidatus Micrarchaeota archaeon]